MKDCRPYRMFRSHGKRHNFEKALVSRKGVQRRCWVGGGRCFISLGGWQNYDNLKRYNTVLMIIVRVWKCVFRRRRNVRISFINPHASWWCLVAGEIYRWGGWFFIFGRIGRCKFEWVYCCNSHIISHEIGLLILIRAGHYIATNVPVLLKSS